MSHIRFREAEVNYELEITNYRSGKSNKNGEWRKVEDRTEDLTVFLPFESLIILSFGFQPRRVRINELPVADVRHCKAFFIPNS
jgi:hypothetical protein